MLQANNFERDSFPIVCETCLGDNPYVRMIKSDFSKQCKICDHPFTVFRWKAGTNARYKQTEICQTCAKIKNVCQVCVLDLVYGLPVQVRDAAMKKAGVEVNELPDSKAGREFQQKILKKELEEGTGVQFDSYEPTALVSALARSQPYYKRNESHVCSFWLKGECNRGSACPYRHEMDNHDPALAKQNIKDRFHGKNDPVALKMFGRHTVKALEPPTDQSVKTLYVGGLEANTTEKEIHDSFFEFGEITNIQINATTHVAFVTFSTRASAENAVERSFGQCTVKGKRVRIGWGRKVDPNIKPPPGLTSSALMMSAKPLVIPSIDHSHPQTVEPFAFPLSEKPLEFTIGSPQKTVYPSMDPSQLGATEKTVQ